MQRWKVQWFRTIQSILHFVYLLTCTWWWWAEQLQLSRAHIWPEFVESVLEWIRWLCFNHVLLQPVPTITDSDTEERFPDGLGTSWNVNFHSVFWGYILLEPSGKTTAYLHVPFLTKSCTFQLNLHAVFVVWWAKVPRYYSLWLRGAKGTKVPENVSPRERMFQRAKVSGSESSTYGTFALGSESTWERKFNNSLLPVFLARSYITRMRNVLCYWSEVHAFCW